MRLSQFYEVADVTLKARKLYVSRSLVEYAALKMWHAYIKHGLIKSAIHAGNKSIERIEVAHVA